MFTCVYIYIYIYTLHRDAILAAHGGHVLGHICLAAVAARHHGRHDLVASTVMRAE